MEPLEEGELSQDELNSLLREWKPPEAPARLRAAVFPDPLPWWMRLWTVSIRVPLPAACALLLLMGGFLWRMARSTPAPPPTPPAVVVRTERVEVPVEHDRVVTKYVYVQPHTAGLTFDELRPVSELRPRIIRREDAKH